MSHHNFDTPSTKLFRDNAKGLDDAKKQLLREFAGLGATGRYPDGRYGDHDEGEIYFAVAADRQERKVLIDFGKPVHSLGMTPEQASELADMLQKKAWEARGIDS